MKQRLPTPDCSRASYLTFSPDGGALILGTPDGHVQIYDRHAGERLADLKAGDGPIRSVVFFPGRLRVLSGTGFTTSGKGDPPTSTVADPLEITDHPIRLTP